MILHIYVDPGVKVALGYLVYWLKVSQNINCELLFVVIDEILKKCY